MLDVAMKKELKKASKDEYRKKNKEKIATQMALYYENHKDEIKDRQTRNKQRINSVYAEYREKNKTKIAKVKAAYYAKNKEKLNAYSSMYRKENPEVFVNASIKRRGLKDKSGVSLSSGLAEKLIKLQRGRCACCKNTVKSGYHLDHIMPLKLGGLNVDSNIQILCPTCNLQKSSKHPVDFMQSRGFLF